MTLRTLPWVTIQATLALGGCGVFEDTPYLIEDLQVVAVVAEPPEVHPGEQSVLSAIVVDPHHPHGPIQASWSYCPGKKEGQNAVRCGSDAVSLVADSPERLYGGIFQTTTQHTPERRAFLALPQVVLLAGFWQHVRVRATSRGQDREAFKRVVVVADERQPNTNPILEGVRIERRGGPLEEPYQARPKDRLVLVPRLASTSQEAYEVLGQDGSWQHRQEEAVITWYVTSGELNRWVTQKDATITWSLPEKDDLPSSNLLVFAVLRDGRGGAAVWLAEISVD